MFLPSKTSIQNHNNYPELTSKSDVRKGKKRNNDDEEEDALCIQFILSLSPGRQQQESAGGENMRVFLTVSNR
jgi:hypothetical protein